jgi:hypothetical protein
MCLVVRGLTALLGPDVAPSGTNIASLGGDNDDPFIPVLLGLKRFSFALHTTGGGIRNDLRRPM